MKRTISLFFFVDTEREIDCGQFCARFEWCVTLSSSCNPTNQRTSTRIHHNTTHDPTMHILSKPKQHEYTSKKRLKNLWTWQRSNCLNPHPNKNKTIHIPTRQTRPDKNDNQNWFAIPIGIQISTRSSNANDETINIAPQQNEKIATCTVKQKDLATSGGGGRRRGNKPGHHYIYRVRETELLRLRSHRDSFPMQAWCDVCQTNRQTSNNKSLFCKY